MTTGQRSAVAWVSMLVIGIAWGATIPLTKTAVSTGYQPFGLIFWQLVLSALVLGAYLVATGWRPSITQQKLVFYAVVALIGTLIPNGFSYIAAAQLPAGVMSINIALVPMFGLVFALLWRIESFSWVRTSGILIGFAAMALIALPETSLPEPDKAIYLLVALLAPICYGLESNYLAKYTPSETDPISTLFMASVLGLIFITPLALATDQWIDPLVPWGVAEMSLIAASIIHAFTYVGYIWLVGFGGPVFGAQVAYPVTLAGVFLSIFFLSEEYSAWVWSALVLVILALFLVQPKLEKLETEASNV